MSNKIYPIGIQNFEKIRKDGYFYIDKTAWVYQLAKTGSYYFLSRPRRFGKSLLISTLEAYFRGKKELFKGLAIEKLEKDWTEHPILHLDLNIERYDTPESLGNILEKNLSEWGKTLWRRCFRTYILFALCRNHQACLRADRAACGNPCGRIRQTDAPGYRQRGTAKGILQHAETFLRCA